MSNLRRLNDEGIRRMVEFLDSQTTDEPMSYESIEPILRSGDTSESLPKNVPVVACDFPTRFDLAKWLHDAVPRTGLTQFDRDAGLWCWLALAWFPAFCRRDKEGRFSPGERARWLPQFDVKRRVYRHFVYGPFLMLTPHLDEPDRTRGTLSDPVYVSTSETFRSFVETTLAVCPAALNLCTRMYYDAASGNMRRGVGVKTAGGVRRLIIVLQQFDRTFDLHTISADRLAMMLPREFKKWLSGAKT